MRALKMTLAIAIGLGGIIAAVAIKSSLPPKPHPGPAAFHVSRRSSEYLPIEQMLTRHNVTGCGQYLVHQEHAGEYIVKCSDDGKRWTYYLLLMATDEVGGPYKSLREIPGE